MQRRHKQKINSTFCTYFTQYIQQSKFTSLVGDIKTSEDEELHFMSHAPYIDIFPVGRARQRSYSLRAIAGSSVTDALRAEPET